MLSIMLIGTIGLDAIPDDADLTELLGESTTRAGVFSGKEGLGSGTGNAVSENDSVSNLENA